MPVFHNYDVGSECQCFPDIVCDKNDGHSQFAVNTGNFGLQHFSGDFVDGSERFVHEQDVRIGGQGACNSYSLALSSGEFRGITVEHFLFQTDDSDESFYSFAGTFFVVLVKQARYISDIFPDSHVRKQSDSLDDIADIAA